MEADSFLVKTFFTFCTFSLRLDCATGLEYFDYVALAPALPVEEQLIGAAEFAIGFDGVDGILGCA